MNNHDEQILNRKIENRIIERELEYEKGFPNDETMLSDHMTSSMNDDIENDFITTIENVRAAKMDVLLKELSREIKNDKISDLLTKLIHNMLSIEDFDTY